MQQEDLHPNHAGDHRALFFFAFLCCAFLFSSCGERKVIIIEVEEEVVSQSPSSSGPPSPQSIPGMAGPGEGDPEPGLQEPSSDSKTTADKESDQASKPTSPRPAVNWEPKAVADILNLYCAGPCHGVHGKFSNKDYFLSLTPKHLDQLTSGRMPPPGLFKNFRGSADQDTLTDWLESQ